MVEIIPLAAIAPAAVEALLDAAFGADRHARTAYRLRAGLAMIPELSLAAVASGRLAGSIQCWPVAHIAGAGKQGGGPITPLVLVGPVAVAPDVQQRGIGKRLMHAMLDLAPAHADGALMMIGDPDYYDRFFGFTSVATGGWALPGPVEPQRLLARPVGPWPVPAVPGRIGTRQLAPAAASPMG